MSKKAINFVEIERHVYYILIAIRVDKWPSTLYGDTLMFFHPSVNYLINNYLHNILIYIDNEFYNHQFLVYLDELK